MRNSRLLLLVASLSLAIAPARAADDERRILREVEIEAAEFVAKNKDTESWKDESFEDVWIPRSRIAPSYYERSSFTQPALHHARLEFYPAGAPGVGHGFRPVKVVFPAVIGR